MFSRQFAEPILMHFRREIDRWVLRVGHRLLSVTKINHKGRELGDESGE